MACHGMEFGKNSLQLASRAPILRQGEKRRPSRWNVHENHSNHYRYILCFSSPFSCLCARCKLSALGRVSADGDSLCTRNDKPTTGATRQPSCLSRNYFSPSAKNFCHFAVISLACLINGQNPFFSSSSFPLRPYYFSKCRETDSLHVAVTCIVSNMSL